MLGNIEGADAICRMDDSGGSAVVLWLVLRLHSFAGEVGESARVQSPAHVMSTSHCRDMDDPAWEPGFGGPQTKEPAMRAGSVTDNRQIGPIKLRDVQTILRATADINMQRPGGAIVLSASRRPLARSSFAGLGERHMGSHLAVRVFA